MMTIFIQYTFEKKASEVFDKALERCQIELDTEKSSTVGQEKKSELKTDTKDETNRKDDQNIQKKDDELMSLQVDTTEKK